MEENEKYNRAKKRVEALKGFYGHLITYVLVNLMLLAINLWTSPGELWFYWPLIGWGIGLAWHAAGVFLFDKIGKDWEERKIRELMEKDR